MVKIRKISGILFRTCFLVHKTHPDTFRTVVNVKICVLLTAFYPFKVTIAYIVIKDITVKMGSKRACADTFVKITHPRFAQLHALEQLTF